MRHILLLLFVLCFLCPTEIIQSAPARHKPRQIIQPDGSVITVLLQGDEFKSQTTLLDGTPVTISPEGVVTKTTRSFLPEKTLRTPLNTTKATPSTNKKQKGLVFLVQFSDLSFQSNDPQKEFSDFLNKEGYQNSFGQKGSARDYFVANSMGQFNPEFTVIGPITMSKASTYYGIGKSDIYMGDLILETLSKVNFEGVDLSQFDSDNNGEIDFMYFFYAGYGENNSGANTNWIWPHAWRLSGWGKSSPVIQGKTFNTYACSQELQYISGNTMDGIGTFCHEFSHVLGLQDTYDVDYEASGGESFGLGEWSIMSHGLYNNNGNTPCCLTAYERYSLGWLDLKELTTPADIVLKDLATYNEGYILKSSRSNEFFILENRQSTGWDSSLYGHGMLIHQIDYNDPAWISNRININPLHPYWRIRPADNSLPIFTRDNIDSYYTDMEGDPYPGKVQNRFFTDTSTPSSTLWSGATLNKPLTNITEESGQISFQFMGGSSSAPVTGNDSFSLFCRSGELIVRIVGQTQTLTLSDLSGRNLISRQLSPGEHTLSLPFRGVLLVTINGITCKIVH